MPFRFSIKWLLAATLYCAIAAAALTQEGWAYAAILWFMTFVAFVYAALLAFYLRGASQARAIGFVIGSACLCVCLNAAPENIPSQRVVAALGGGQSQVVFASPPFYPGSQATVVAPSTPLPYAPPPAMASGTLSIRQAPALSVTYQSPETDALRLRAVNALATMLAGLGGALLGTTALRKSMPSPG